MTGRVALYYAPEPGSELDRFGASWLGRDAVTGRSIDAPVLPGITGSMRRDITATARKYGFHATLKPPFALATSRVGFDEAVAEFARNMAPFEAPPLTVGVLDGFVALLPSAPSPELRALADGCVTAFRKHAAPPRRCGTGAPPRCRVDPAAGTEPALVGVSLCVGGLPVSHDADQSVAGPRPCVPVARGRV